LDLLQLSTIHMAEFCAGPAQITRSKMIQLHPFRAPSNNIPDDVLGNSFAPRRTVTADSPENPARCDLGGRHPSIDGGLHPSWYRRGPNVTAFANQVDDGPMSLPDLDVINFESGKLSTPKSATRKYRDHCKVTKTAQAFPISFFQDILA
jgi:hypothetical protein